MLIEDLREEEDPTLSERAGLDIQATVAAATAGKKRFRATMVAVLLWFYDGFVPRRKVGSIGRFLLHDARTHKGGNGETEKMKRPDRLSHSDPGFSSQNSF